MNLKLAILLALVGIAFSAVGQSEVQNDLLKGSEPSGELSKDLHPSQNQQQSEASQPLSADSQPSRLPRSPPPPTGRPTGSPGPRTRRPGQHHHHKGKGTFYFDFFDKK